MGPLFIVKFKDGEMFEGGFTYQETKWMQIPAKEIEGISYRMPDGNYLTLGGFDSYFHMVEAVQDIYGGRPGVVSVEHAYIMGKKEDKVISYRFTLSNRPGNKYGFGDMTRREYSVNDDKIKKLNQNVWTFLKVK